MSSQGFPAAGLHAATLTLRAWHFEGALFPALVLTALWSNIEGGASWRR